MRRVRTVFIALLILGSLVLTTACSGARAARWWDPCPTGDCCPVGDPCDCCDPCGC